MTDSPSAPATDGQKAHEPNETLSGDRLCMQCMHPLVGSPIVREPQTGLLYVRCGECGTASALFEYPTIGPWLRRMKAVTSSTLIAISIVMIIVIAGISFGFAGGSAGAASEAAGSALIDRYRLLGGVVDDATWQGTPWGPANMQWVASAEGQAELARVRFAATPVIVLLGINAIGALVLCPFTLMLGVALMRRSVLERMLFAALLIGSAIAILIALDPVMFGGRLGAASTWNTVATEHHGLTYCVVSGAILAAVGMASVAVAPALAAALARFILPPRDRRLVSWLWEWRGKAVPRD